MTETVARMIEARRTLRHGPKKPVRSKSETAKAKRAIETLRARGTISEDQAAKLSEDVDANALPARGRGRPKGSPWTDDLSDLDKQILRLARAYFKRTGKPACNGTQGRKITNQGGPFVREAAKSLNVSEARIMTRIRHMARSESYKDLWHRWRNDKSAEGFTFRLFDRLIEMR